MSIKGGGSLPYAKQAWFQDRRDRVAEVVLSEVQVSFIEWLLDPTRSGSQAAWGREHGMGERQLINWKRGAAFRREWEKRAAEMNASPERVQDVVNALYKNAAGGDVKAAHLYLQYVDKYTPTRKIITEDRGVQEMSDEELADTLENVTQLRKKGA